MPEGPEVRRYADLLHDALAGKPLQAVSARTRAAKAWLLEHPGAFEGKCVLSVRARGKNLIGRVEGDLFFYSHLMMWGRWQLATHDDAPPEPDKRERARLTVEGTSAILLSAPIFEVGQGEPMEQTETLRRLGPDTLPYPDEPPFDRDEFVRRLLLPAHAVRPIGAVLLDQEVCAGIGNYLRAEILFDCRLDPWHRAGALEHSQLERLCDSIEMMVRRAYETGGATVPDAGRERMRNDISLVYRGGSEWGTRHFVFRRTNLPCLECGTLIKQLRQVTREWESEDGAEEKSRIIYFCPVCQGTEGVPKPPKARHDITANTTRKRKQQAPEVSG